MINARGKSAVTIRIADHRIEVTEVAGADCRFRGHHRWIGEPPALGLHDLDEFVIEVNVERPARRLVVGAGDRFHATEFQLIAGDIDAFTGPHDLQLFDFPREGPGHP